MFRIAVICRRGTATMQMDDGARLGQLPARAVETVVDGEEMPRWQMIVPLDRQPFVTVSLEQGTDGLRSVTPKPRRRKVTVHLDANLAHGDMATPALQRGKLGKRQWIDEGLQL